jgi:hypothetical protein
MTDQERLAHVQKLAEDKAMTLIRQGFGLVKFTPAPDKDDDAEASRLLFELLGKLEMLKPALGFMK